MPKTLTAADLEDTHPHLPDRWRRSMVEIRQMGGPWECDTCEGPSYQIHRCSKCGADLAGGS